MLSKYTNEAGEVYESPRFTVEINNDGYEPAFIYDHAIQSAIHWGALDECLACVADWNETEPPYATG